MPDHEFLPRLRSKFLAFEGPDGSGKTTQFRRFVSLCTEAGLNASEVREPGGTPIGEQVRSILLHTRESMTLRCEMLLYMASRNQLVEERIRPALARGDVVLADRFVASTYAYQGSGGGIPVEEISAVANVACGTTFPDLIIIFDVDQETAARRIRGVDESRKRKQVAAGDSLFDDRIERRGREFHERVRTGYLEQAAREPRRHLVIDATRSPEEVWCSLITGLSTFFCQ